MNIKEKIRYAASKQGLTVAQIARDCDLSPSVISKWVNSMPSVDKAIAVANRLGVSVDWLFNDEDELEYLPDFKTVSPEDCEPEASYFVEHHSGNDLTKAESDLLSMYNKLDSIHKIRLAEIMRFYLSEIDNEKP